MYRFLPLACAAATLCGCGKVPLTPRDPDPGAFHFVLQTYNLNNDEGGDQNTLAALGQASADVVCLQEVTTVWQEAIEARYANKYPYRAFKIDPGGGAAGLGIMSRFAIRDGGWRPGPIGWHPSWYHLVDTPHGTVSILNTHLRNATGEHGGTVESYLRTDEDHLYEIKQQTDRCTTVFPTIVVGDFNEGTGGAAIRYLEQTGYQNILPLYHPGQPTWHYKSTVGGQFSQTLDHILFDASFEPLNAWVVNAGSSDHLPVLAHLEAGPQGW
jgi:endonuclease/exonuclease/phosphatase family metal-dependent hydrolase